MSIVNTNTTPFSVLESSRILDAVASEWTRAKADGSLELLPGVTKATIGGQMKAGYLYNPDLSAVEGVPIRYWKYVNGAVRPMTMAERGARDELLNPTDNEKIAVEAIFQKANKDITAAEVIRTLRWLLEKRGAI